MVDMMSCSFGMTSHRMYYSFKSFMTWKSQREVTYQINIFIIIHFLKASANAL